MRLLVVLLFVIGIKAPCFAQRFTGQVYLLSKNFLEDKCVVYPECDCCSTDLIFLTNKTFSMINRCLYNDAYFKGKYLVKGDKLILTFEQTVVNEIYDEENDLWKNEKENLKVEPIHFIISHCGVNKIRLKHATTGDFKNGSRQSIDNEQRIMKRLKESKAWKLIL